MAGKDSELIKHPRVREALAILEETRFPKGQLNLRTALVLLALCDMKPDARWENAAPQLLGITQIMGWIRNVYGKVYAPNTRETIRDDSVKPFMNAGMAVCNPHAKAKGTNYPGTAYQLSDEAAALIRDFGSQKWSASLERFLAEQQNIADKYAKARDMERISVTMPDGFQLRLSPGSHSALIKEIITEFGSRFAPGSDLVYVGDTETKWGYANEQLMANLGLSLNEHGKMPDVILYLASRNWLFLIESVTSVGPVSGSRYEELADLFGKCAADLIFVSAFPDRATMRSFLPDLAWETEVWLADSPSHLIHFNGGKFLGPYSARED